MFVAAWVVVDRRRCFDDLKLIIIVHPSLYLFLSKNTYPMKIVWDLGPRYWNPRGEGIGPLRKLDPRDPGCEFDRRCKVKTPQIIVSIFSFQNSKAFGLF